MISIQLPDRTVDLETHQVHGPEGSTALTPTEGRLLARLIQSGGGVVTKTDLLADAMGYRDGVQTRALDAAIRRLRRKLESEQTKGEVLIGVYGVGYRLHVEPQLPQALLGRGADILAIEAMLEPGIQVLVGPGGVGKTRLALAVRDRWDGASLFVDLTRVVDGAGLAEGLAGALDVPLASPDPKTQRDQIGAVLSARSRVLILLDNSEQIADEALVLLESWVDQAPQCVFLLTSRRSPGRGQTYEVPPLSYEDAVTLYMRRAVQRVPDFRLDEADTAHVLAFVKAVDALPLSIELAASRIQVLSPADLVQRATRLSLRGTSTSHAAATLEECIHWSWQLLDSDERRGWIAAGAFEGGFTLESWEQVSGLDRPLDVLESLLAHQLIRVESSDGGRRYGMLNALHQFARERLAQAPDRAEIERRHWCAMASQAATLSRETESTGDHSWQRREYGNLMIAFERSLSIDSDAAVSCLRALEVIFEQRGPRSVRIDLFTRCLAVLEPEEVEHRSIMLARLGLALCTVGRMEAAVQRSEQSIALVDRLEHAQDRARILLSHGAVLLYAGQSELAISIVAAGAVEAKRAGDAFLLGLTHYNRGYGLILQGHGDEALEVSHLALVHLSASGAPLMVAAAHVLIAYIHLQQGGLEPARIALECAAENIEDRMGLIWLDIRHTRAHLELAAGAAREALAYFEEAIREARKVGFEDQVADLHSGVALALADLGEWSRAEQAFAHARAQQTRLGRPGKAGHALALWGAITWIRGGRPRGLARLRAASVELDGKDPLFAVPAGSMLAIAVASVDRERAKALVLELHAEVPPGGVAGALVEIAECSLVPDEPGHRLERAGRLRGASPDIRLALRMLEVGASL